MKAKLLINILLLSLLASCATGSKKESKSYKHYDEISQESFKSPRLVKYVERKDVVSKAEGKLSEVTNTESLYRTLELSGDVDSDDRIDQLAKLCYKRDFKGAYATARQMQRKYSKNPTYWNALGSCYLKEGKRKKALLFYNLALSYKSNYSPTLNNLGVMYSLEGDYSRAQISFEKATKGNQFSRTPRLNLANLFLSFGLYRNANEHLKTLKSLSNTDVDVLNLSAVSKLMQQEPEKALELYKNIPSSYLEKAQYGVNYALALYTAGKRDDAVDAFNDIETKKLGAWKTHYRSVRDLIGAKK